MFIAAAVVYALTFAALYSALGESGMGASLLGTAVIGTMVIWIILKLLGLSTDSEAQTITTSKQTYSKNNKSGIGALAKAEKRIKSQQHRK